MDKRNKQKNESGQDLASKSLSMKPTFDNQKSINKIATLLLKFGPDNWKQAHFRYIDKDNNSKQWEYYFEIENKQDKSLFRIPTEIDEEIIQNLNELRNPAEFLCPMSEIIFYSNKKYEIKYEHTKVEYLDIAEIQHEIEKIKEFAKAKSDIDDIKKRIAKLTVGYRVVAPFIQAGRKFYRGVIHKEKPKKQSLVTYPPKVEVKKFHRAGRPSQSLFYCSTDKNAVFYELDVNVGDRIVISEWETIGRLLMNNVGYYSSALQKLGTKRNTPFWVEKANLGDTQIHNQIIGNFFAEEFTRVVLFEQEELYKISIAIAEHHFEQSFFDGLLYPAVAYKGNADNLCIKPKSVDEKMVLKRVEYIQVMGYSENNYQIQMLDFANSFTIDGTIEWKGQLPHWVLRKKGDQLTIIAENGKWIARDVNGELIEPE